LVVVSVVRRDALRAILELARKWEWDLLDLGFTRGAIPMGPPPSGALVDCLPPNPLAQRLREIDCPAVRLGNLPHPEDDLLPAVLPDQMAQGRLAAEHLAKRGFKDLAYVGHDPWSDSREVYEGFRARAQALGLTCHLYQLRSGWLSEDETNAARYERRAVEVGKWLDGLPKPVAVLGYGDSMAARLCTMCMKAGFAVPDEVALLGIGNDELICELSPVVLSSVDVNEAEQGRQAAVLLRRLMAGEAPPPASTMVPPARVVTRRSTEVLAVSNPVVARAMRFMWDHVEQDLSVDDVAKEIRMPRRTLERAFRKQLGRGVNAELRRRRLELFCELLKTTTTPIVDLVPRVGFRSADYLHSAFKRAYGTTPRRWRLAAREKGE